MHSRDAKTPDPLSHAADYLRTRSPLCPKVGIVLGSGLGEVANHLSVRTAISYGDIPGFPLCAVPGHQGCLLIGTWGGCAVAVLQGRIHRYEGYPLEMVVRPIRVLAEIGVEIVILTCAAGWLRPSVSARVFLIEDHLNLMGENPLAGPLSNASTGQRFVQMADAYDRELRTVASATAGRLGIDLDRGVLACVPGPTYETAAEAEMLRRLGGDAVSMSLVPEAIAAKARNLRVLAFAVLTNQSGVASTGEDGHLDVLRIAQAGSRDLARIIDGVLKQVAPTG